MNHLSAMLVWLSLLPFTCTGFNNFSAGRILSKVLGGDESLKKQDAGIQKLQELGLESSTEPKAFSARTEQIPALLAASLPAVFRFGSGVFAHGYQLSITTRRESEYTGLAFDKYQLHEKCQRGRTVQVEPLILYDKETCPECRLVREALCMLGLTVTYKPCPQKGLKYRNEIASQLGEDFKLPYLQDPNTSIRLVHSDRICDYLFKTYGNGKIPWTLSPGSTWVTWTAQLGLIWRGGGSFCNNNAPNQPIELWSYEGSPFCKLVRERLCELEIAHTQVSCPRGGPNRQRMLQEKGRFQVPYIEDPNTGVQLFESEAIMEYLQKMYGVVDSPIKYM